MVTFALIQTLTMISVDGRCGKAVPSARMYHGLTMRRGTLAKSSKRRHVVNVGVCKVHFFHLLPYATLVWVGKSAFIAFIIVCIQAPADAKGGAPVVRARPGMGW